MPPEDKEKLNNVEKLKNKIFSKTYSTKIQYHDGFVVHEKKEIPENWVKENEKKAEEGNFFTKSSAFKKFFIFSVAFFVLAIGYVSYVFFWGSNTVSNDNISIAIFGNAFTDGGEALPLQIEIINKNSTNLDLVDLVVEYPKGSTGDLSEETERQRVTLNTIASGAIRNENINVVLFGEQGSVRPIRITLEYRIEGSNSIFVKEKYYSVTINSTPMNLLLDAPEEITPNQEIVLNVVASLNTNRKLPNTLLKLDYPVGFQYSSAEPMPTLGNNVWTLDSLAPGEEFKVSISGFMVDVFDGEEKTFHVFSGSQSKSDKSIVDVVYNSIAHTVLIQKPFIDAKLYINSVYSKEYAASSKSIIRGQLKWTNNLDTKVNDLSIRIKISGNAPNLKSIDSQDGFYNSADDMIIWDKNSIEDFAEIEAGENGSVLFNLSPISLFSASSGLLKDPIVVIDVSVTGKQALQGNLLKELFNSESKKIKIISDVAFNTKALHFSGPITNTGPIPPKVEQETTYTVVWSITNTSNNISKAEIKSSLPSWSKFMGVISPESADVTYNSATKEIVWKAGSVAPGTGITGPTKEVAFQIAFSPSFSQLNSVPILINTASFKAHDDFAGVDIRQDKSFLNTSLTGDSAFPKNGARVVE
ncbi:MAG: hypothetical protein QG583_199 [Patescibacteria group bacterium]|nr:hypothetical protein [Patescibacteria group bacterium]